MLTTSTLVLKLPRTAYSELTSDSLITLGNHFINNKKTTYWIGNSIEANLTIDLFIPTKQSQLQWAFETITRIASLKLNLQVTLTSLNHQKSPKWELASKRNRWLVTKLNRNELKTSCTDRDQVLWAVQGADYPFKATANQQLKLNRLKNGSPPPC